MQEPNQEQELYVMYKYYHTSMPYLSIFYLHNNNKKKIIITRVDINYETMKLQVV